MHLAFLALILFSVVIGRPVKPTATNFPFNWNAQTLTAPTPLLNSFQVNLKAGTTYTLLHESDVPIQVCFMETYAVPSDPQTWNVSCTIRVTQASSVQNQPIVFRRSTYNIGIYWAAPVDPGKTTRFTLQIGKGEEACGNATNIFDTQKCIIPATLVAGTTNLTLHEGPQVLTFQVPSDPILTGSIKITGDASLTFFIRRNGAPSSQFADASGTGSAVYPDPRPGTYFVLINASQAQTSEITLTLEDCTQQLDPHGSGIGCKTIFNHAEDDESVPGVSNQFYYFQAVVDKGDKLRVSVASNDGQPAPRLLLSRGALPSLMNADFTGCNVDGCGYANIIQIQAGETDETWYFGAIPAPGVSRNDYGIWLDDECAPSCELNGVCTKTGPDTGKCVCTEADDKGVGCQITQSLSRQYVVLASIWVTAIVLGVLVLLAQFVTSNKETYERLA